MCRIAAFSTAGGTGKATTAMNLTAAVAERGKHVLAVDLAPGSRLLRAFGQTRSRALLDAVERNRHLVITPMPLQPRRFAKSPRKCSSQHRERVQRREPSSMSEETRHDRRLTVGKVGLGAIHSANHLHHIDLPDSAKSMRRIEPADETKALENQRPRMFDDDAVARTAVEPAKPTFDEAPPTPPANPVDPLGGNTRSR